MSLAEIAATSWRVREVDPPAVRAPDSERHCERPGERDERRVVGS